MKTNRKALLTSIISLLICVTMLIGTTFAWFTDTASTKVSKIQAGTLKVELWGADVENGKVKELKNIGNETEALFNYDLWEPGYTSYKVIELKNVGNLAFEYAVDITRNLGEDGTNVATILPDVIDVYFNVYTSLDAVPTTFNRDDYKEWTSVSLADVLKGDKDGVVHGVLLPKGATADNSGYEMVENVYAVIALHMQESAGNDYMNLTEKFDIKLYAKQWTEEYDSNGNQYDKDATYKDREVAKECDHQNKTVKHNEDGTHSYYCPTCETTLDEEVTTTYEIQYNYKSDGQHTVSCTCGNMTQYLEECDHSTGDCAKCHNHTHDETNYNYEHISDTNTHKVKYTCCGEVKTESEACVDDDGDKKCDICGGNLTIAPASATVTINTNTPGLTGVNYKLMSGEQTVASAVAEANGTVSFVLNNLTETTTYTVVPSADDVTFTEINQTVTVTVTYDNENLKYNASADEVSYVSGYTKTIASYDFSDESQLADWNCHWNGGADSLSIIDGRMHFIGNNHNPYYAAFVTSYTSFGTLYEGYTYTITADVYACDDSVNNDTYATIFLRDGSAKGYNSETNTYYDLEVDGTDLAFTDSKAIAPGETTQFTLTFTPDSNYEKAYLVFNHQGEYFNWDSSTSVNNYCIDNVVITVTVPTPTN